MPGPRPTPTHLKIIKGNPGRRRLPKNEPRPHGALHEAPTWLNERQLLGWAYAIANSPRGLLTPMDRDMLAIWVVAADRYREACEHLNAEGLVAPSTHHGNKAMVQSAWLRIERQQAEIMLRCCDHLGFSPASRTRIEMAVEPTSDEWDWLLGPPSRTRR
jgi:P27 family predicted phage terminase small subunit